LAHFIARLIGGGIDLTDFSLETGGVLGSVLALAGFISSVLGIISFYLEYLR
jgi:hypothetical protein